METSRKFERLVRRTRSVMDELEQLSKANSTVTIFAPDDTAFEGFDEEKELPTTEKLEHVSFPCIPLRFPRPASAKSEKF